MGLLAVAAALVAATAAMAHSPDARIASSCGVGSGTGYGYTYLTSLTVKNTSCSTGKTVARHHGKVKGWRCSTKRLASSPVQVQNRETCKSGSKQIVWTDTQNK
ncbi:MAG: hypothetical protein ACR2NR_10855 [Solirubrobacteraceae bacterium]